MARKLDPLRTRLLVMEDFLTVVFLQIFVVDNLTEMMRLQSLMRNSSMLGSTNGDHVNLFPYSPQTYLDPTTARLPKQTGASTKKRLKLPIPADKYPEYNFVGRLLGPRGATLKAMEKDTGCKIMIRGKGSIRKDKEGDVRGKPGYEHVFSEPLHVVIEAEMEENAAMRALLRAKEEIELLLVHVPEDRDQLKKQQLRDLAIMNGTLRSTSSTNFNGSHQEYSSDLNIPGLSTAATGSVQHSDALDELHFPFDDITTDDHFTTTTVDNNTGVGGGSSSGGGNGSGNSSHASPTTMRQSNSHFSFYEMSNNLRDPISMQVPASEGIAIERKKPSVGKGINWSMSSSVPNAVANSLPLTGQRASSPLQWGSSFAGLGGLWGSTNEPLSYIQPTSMMRSIHNKEGHSTRMGIPLTETTTDQQLNNHGDEFLERKL